MMQERLTIEITATTVAWYAAIVSTVTAFLQVANFVRDRARGKISYQSGMQAMNFPGIPRDKVFTIVTVVNAGRRPFTVVKVAFKGLREKCWWVLAQTIPQIPHQLTEGNHLSVLQDEAKLQLSDVACIVAWTADGRKFTKGVASVPRRILWAGRRGLVRMKSLF